MRKNQIIYFLNAVYYGIWTINMKFGDFIGRIVGAILSPVPKYFFQNLIRKNIINVCLQRGKKQRSFYMIAKVDTT